jgi:L-asparaginase/Glu-tRNA(Gln) amidotransferase subunit D
LLKKGMIVATTFPSGEQVTSPPAQPSQSNAPRTITVNHLLPTKARILMMLALTRTQSAEDIQRIFDSF